jgi:hypothetical protein
LLVIGPDLPGEAQVGLADAIVAWVWGAHAGKDLGHGAKALLHGLLANGPTVGGKLACAHLVGKHLEERDWVMHTSEGQVKL